MATDPMWISLSGCDNIRDLAGLPMASGARTRAGVLLRSDAPDDVTPDDIDILRKRYDLALVVDLRSEFEQAEGSALEAAGVTTLRWPLSAHLDSEDVVSSTRPAQQAAWTEDHADEYFEAIYLRIVELFRPHAVELLERLVAGTGATLVHCAGGKDRTGVIVSLLLLAAGVDRAAVVADYAVSDLRMDRLNERVRARGTGPYEADQFPEVLMRVRASTIDRLLTALEAGYGDIRAWWLAAGATPEQLGAWQARLAAAEGSL